jgi:hypothetical protein
MMRLVVMLALAAAIGCGHTKEAEKPEKPETAPAEAAAPPPRDILEDGAIKRIQQKLVEWGYDVKETGRLDRKTTRALQAFQRGQDMPDTGLPDQRTLEKLGLDPEEIYKPQPSDRAKR